jgi:hypothetical protein
MYRGSGGSGSSGSGGSSHGSGGGRGIIVNGSGRNGISGSISFKILACRVDAPPNYIGYSLKVL